VILLPVNLRFLANKIASGICLFFIFFASPLLSQTVVYQLNPSSLALGSLVGQNGWTGSSASFNAGQIISTNGSQEFGVFGALIPLSSPAFYYCSFSRSLANYNPVTAGTPIVDITASVCQNQGTNTSQSTQYTFFILDDQNGNAFGTIALDQNGIVFGQNWAPTNQVIGNGATATNGFHSLKLELNFTNKTITGFLDNFSIGTMAFNSGASNELGSLNLVMERYANNPITSTLYVTNLSVTAGSVISQSQCSLQIESAGPCTPDGNAGVPTEEEAYGIRVVVNVLGKPAKPFNIRWTLANQVNYYSNVNVGPGNGYWWPYITSLSLDEDIPWSVTLDPDGVSGSTNLAAMTASGVFTPTPPASAVHLYSTRLMNGIETSILNFQPGSGVIPNLWVLFGSPTTHGAQNVLSVMGPSNAVSVVTPPYNIPVYAITWSNALAGTFQENETFMAQLNSMSVNPSILRSITWAQMQALPANVSEWLAPDVNCESTNSQIAAFVQQSLPANYTTTLTPYDTARMLHLAVMKKLTYQTPTLYGDAVNVLQVGVADCGGFAALLTASLRNAGIPARRISGFWQGDGWQNDVQWHIRVEFYLPGAGWLVADPTAGNSDDPTGTYPYDFCCVPDANSFFAMDVGDSHILPYCTFAELQVPNFLWFGGATFSTNLAVSYLQPFNQTSISPVQNGYVTLSLTNVPTEGSVIVESSTNLLNWSPIATNSASGSPLTYHFPLTNHDRCFYWPVQIP
jgi:transglutaminase-like putative cysteine protease